jgi:hypothetical protein
MPLIEVIVLLVVVGIILWAVNTYIPMQSAIKRILNIVVIVIVILWLFQLFGLFSSLGGVRVGG